MTPSHAEALALARLAKETAEDSDIGVTISYDDGFSGKQIKAKQVRAICAALDAAEARATEADKSYAHALEVNIRQNALLRECRAERETERAHSARLRAALGDIGTWLQKLKPSGHDGDEESGQCDEDCNLCQWQAIDARIDDALTGAPNGE